MTYNPDCKTPTEVYINQTRIPAADVDIYLRKDGPMAINRYVTVQFAARFNGEDFRKLFDGLNAESSTQYITCHIRGRYEGEGATYPIFTGLVTTVGAIDKTGTMYELRAIGPEMLADKLPFGQTYRDATLKDPTRDILSELSDTTPLTYSEFVPDKDRSSVIASDNAGGGTTAVDL